MKKALKITLGCLMVVTGLAFILYSVDAKIDLLSALIQAGWAVGITTLMVSGVFLVVYTVDGNEGRAK